MLDKIEYNFDEKINRKNTNCAKYDGLKKYFGYEDLNPLWVADMDFKTPAFINDAIINAAKNSLYGYSIDSDALYESIINWQNTQHNWQINKEDIYVATIDGQLIKLSASLNEVKSKKYKYAKFHALAFTDSLYAVESQGFLVNINEDFSKDSVYDFSFDNEERMIAIGNRIYFESKYITLP